MVKNIKHTRHQEQSCPKCGSKLDSATAIFEEDAAPKEGDFSVCIKCSSVLRYGENFELILSSIEFAESLQPGLGKQLEIAITCNKRESDHGEDSPWRISRVSARHNKDLN